MKKQNGNMKPTSFIGFALIVLAVLLFLNNVGFKLAGMLFQHWPAVMVAAGAYMLFSASKSKDKTNRYGVTPYVLIGVGVVMMFGRYGLFHFSVGAVIGPIILLMIGLHLFKPEHRLCKQKKKLNPENTLEHAASQAAPTNDDEGENTDSKSFSPDDDSKIDIFAILGGGNYSSRSHKLTGGNILCVMGGAEIDLRDADAVGDVVELDVLAFMGGAEIKIPPHWQVTVKAIPLLGGVSNKTTCLAEKMGVPKKHLVITGIACMGGIEVKN